MCMPAFWEMKSKEPENACGQGFSITFIIMDKLTDGVTHMTGGENEFDKKIKNMRQFYEEWSPYANRQPLADDLDVNGEGLLIAMSAYSTFMNVRLGLGINML